MTRRHSYFQMYPSVEVQQTKTLLWHIVEHRQLFLSELFEFTALLQCSIRNSAVLSLLPVLIAFWIFEKQVYYSCLLLRKEFFRGYRARLSEDDVVAFVPCRLGYNIAGLSQFSTLSTSRSSTQVKWKDAAGGSIFGGDITFT